MTDDNSMDIHEEIYRNRTPDGGGLEGKATPDSGVDVTSYLERDADHETARPETILEEAEGDQLSARTGDREDTEPGTKTEPTQHVDEGIEEDATPDPRVGADNEKQEDEEKTKQGDEGKQEVKESEVEWEMIDREMTSIEIEEMYHAVIAGDIDVLDDLMDLPGAHLNCEWFQENLLMAAIRHNQGEMAEFLIDNGIDYNYKATLVDITKKKPLTCMDWYTVSCRQLAYEREMMQVVELIDQLNGDLWSFMKPRERVIRLKQPLEEKLRERGQWVSSESEAEEGDDERSSIVSVNGSRKKQLRKKRSDGEEDNRSCDSRSSKGTAQLQEHMDMEQDGHSHDSHQSNLLGLNSIGKLIGSSGYSSVSSVPSPRDMPGLLDPLYRPPSPHKYRGTKASFSRARMSHSQPSSSVSYYGSLPNGPTSGGVPTEKRLWVTSHAGNSLGKVEKAVASPFSKRHKGQGMVVDFSQRDGEKERPRLKPRVPSAPPGTGRSLGGASAAGGPGQMFCDPLRTSRVRPQYLDKTIRRQSTLYGAEGRAPVRSLRADMISPTLCTGDSGTKSVSRKHDRIYSSASTGNIHVGNTTSRYGPSSASATRIFTGVAVKRHSLSSSSLDSDTWVDRMSKPSQPRFRNNNLTCREGRLPGRETCGKVGAQQSQAAQPSTKEGRQAFYIVPQTLR